jgi:protein SCO1/2
MKRSIRLLAVIRNFLIGGGFPAFALSLLVFWELFLIGLLLVPITPSGLGAFAEDFRIWCFGYDPETGHTDWAYVMAMTIPQLMIGATIALLWWEPLREILKQPRVFARHMGAACFLVVSASIGLTFSASQASEGELTFPAEELRTAYEAPEFVLTNQIQEPVELAALQGKVVILTAVYASCAHTCPAILTQAKAAIAQLGPEQRADLRLVAVTLDPDHDSPEILARLAKVHGLQAPLYNLVTGVPSEVERILDRMQFARERDPETGVISHANLFLLIDREGKVAYRLGLGERQQRWLVSALKVLLKEEAASG